MNSKFFLALTLLVAGIAGKFYLFNILSIVSEGQLLIKILLLHCLTVPQTVQKT